MIELRDSQPLWDWINERHAIFLRKSALEGARIPAWAAPGAPPELDLGRLTLDSALSTFRFCNVFRELDRVTVWVREQIRERWADSPELWLMLAIARQINWPPTLAELIERGVWPGLSNNGFDPRHLARAIAERAARGEKIETGAYMIRAESHPTAEWYSWPKHRYVAEVVIGRLWEARNVLSDALERLDTLEAAWGLLCLNRHFIGWGPFTSFEWVTDLRHTRHLAGARDIMTWANPGPGALRGINRLAGRPARAPLRREDAIEAMRSLLAESETARAAWVPPLEMRDIEHSLCETDKWLRAKTGEGRPRARFVPGRGW